MSQARRLSPAFSSHVRNPDREQPRIAPRPPRVRPREFLYSRRLGDRDRDFFVAAHLILRKTAKRVYVTRRSYGPDQLGTEDERWDDHEPAIALDRLKLERDGSVYSSGHRLSDFYVSREQAEGEPDHLIVDAFERLGLRPPASLEDIKTAYRRKALEAHPDRGGDSSEFQRIEAAYRQLLREAQVSEI